MAGLTALIPLDGTKLSESAFAMLPLIKTLGVENVELVSVWQGLWEYETSERPGPKLQEFEEKGRAYVEAYLAQEATRVEGVGLSVKKVALSGRAADEILRAAAESRADLIVIATHGRDGLARWRLGSVADKVVRHATCPTLVIGPNVEIELEPYTVHRILVPLDGSPLAEEVLPIATWIAARTGAGLDLVRAVSLPPMDYEYSMGYVPGLLTELEDAGRAYLAGVATKLGTEVQAQSYLSVGPAGLNLLEQLRDHPAQLVIMMSHGRGGIARTALGSVVDRLLHGPAPVLVLRSEELEGKLSQAAKEELASKLP